MTIDAQEDLVRGEPGWIQIGKECSAGRRSLWVRFSDDAFELCAGREGDDAYARITSADPQYEALLAVMLAARFAAET